MARKAGTVEEYIFGVSRLTASAEGLFDSFSNRSINGTIKSITFLPNTYTATGSLLLFPSGLQNSGTNLGELIFRIRAGSINMTIYPATYTYDNQFVIGSATNDSAHECFVVNGPLRLVGSGLGNATSGIGIIVKYI